MATETRISSSDWFVRARELWLTSKRRPRLYQPFEYVDEWHDGVHDHHVQALLDPKNWSPAVRDANRKPRVFLDARRNQGGNLEVRWAGGERNVFFEEDFDPYFASQAASGAYGARRSLGEVMWVRNLDVMASLVQFEGCEISKAILAGTVARLEELADELATGVELIGRVVVATAELGSLEFAPTLSSDQLLAIWSRPVRRPAPPLR